jgi:hypothetical protein
MSGTRHKIYGPPTWMQLSGVFKWRRRVNHRHELFGNLGVAFGNCIVVVASLAQADIAAAIVGDDYGAWHDGILDKATQESALQSARWAVALDRHSGRPSAVLRRARLAAANLHSGGHQSSRHGLRRASFRRPTCTNEFKYDRQSAASRPPLPQSSRRGDLLINSGQSESEKMRGFVRRNPASRRSVAYVGYGTSAASLSGCRQPHL